MTLHEKIDALSNNSIVVNKIGSSILNYVGNTNTYTYKFTKAYSNVICFITASAIIGNADSLIASLVINSGTSTQLHDYSYIARGTDCSIKMVTYSIKNIKANDYITVNVNSRSCMGLSLVSLD